MEAKQLTGRQLRVKFLAEHYEELGLANYPWGLSKTVSTQRVERYNREIVIFRRLQSEKLMSTNTGFHDSNISNLIKDARSARYNIKRSKQKNESNHNGVDHTSNPS